MFDAQFFSVTIYKVSKCVMPSVSKSVLCIPPLSRYSPKISVAHFHMFIIVHEIRSMSLSHHLNESLDTLHKSESERFIHKSDSIWVSQKVIIE